VGQWFESTRAYQKRNTRKESKMEVDVQQQITFVDYKFVRNWQNNGNVIMFDKEISMKQLDVKIGDAFVVDMRDDQVCFVAVDLQEELEGANQLDLFSS
jgi:formylmethanofuran dehydrogenase subunit D